MLMPQWMNMCFGWKMVDHRKEVESARQRRLGERWFGLCFRNTTRDIHVCRKGIGLFKATLTSWLLESVARIRNSIADRWSADRCSDPATLTSPVAGLMENFWKVVSCTDHVNWLPTGDVAAARRTTVPGGLFSFVTPVYKDWPLEKANETNEINSPKSRNYSIPGRGQGHLTLR